MTYHTDSAIIRHIFENLLPNVLEKYKLTKEEKSKLTEVCNILLKLAKRIDKKNETDIQDAILKVIKETKNG